MKHSSGEKVCPFPRIIGTEDAKICFNLLIGLLSLSIHLRIICSRKLDIIVKESCKFFGKGGSELRASVRYQRVMEAKSFEHVVEEKL